MKKAEFFERVSKIEGVHRVEEDWFMYCEELKSLRVHFHLKLSETPNIEFGLVYLFPPIYSKTNLAFIEGGWISLKHRMWLAYNSFCQLAERKVLPFTQEGFDSYLDKASY